MSAKLTNLASFKVVWAEFVSDLPKIPPTAYGFEAELEPIFVAISPKLYIDSYFPPTAQPTIPPTLMLRWLLPLMLTLIIPVLYTLETSVFSFEFLTEPTIPPTLTSLAWAVTVMFVLFEVLILFVVFPWTFVFKP